MARCQGCPSRSPLYGSDAEATTYGYVNRTKRAGSRLTYFGNLICTLDGLSSQALFPRHIMKNSLQLHTASSLQQKGNLCLHSKRYLANQSCKDVHMTLWCPYSNVKAKRSGQARHKAIGTVCLDHNKSVSLLFILFSAKTSDQQHF